MGVTLDLAPHCQLDKFQNKLNSTKGEVATFIFSHFWKIIRPIISLKWFKVNYTLNYNSQQVYFYEY